MTQSGNHHPDQETVYSSRSRSSPWCPFQSRPLLFSSNITSAVTSNKPMSQFYQFYLFKNIGSQNTYIFFPVTLTYVVVNCCISFPLPCSLAGSPKEMHKDVHNNITYSGSPNWKQFKYLARQNGYTYFSKFMPLHF